jgi:16S rRNA (cytosine967-C5)-methyltransferase
MTAPRRPSPSGRPRPEQRRSDPRRRPPAVRSARRVALDCLVEVDGGRRANVVVPAALDGSSLDARDRGFVTELVYGVCRMRRACDWLVDRHVRGPTDPEVRAALRLGAYQLVWLRVPSHAAVSATVDEVRGPGRTMVNAVLRRVAAQADKGRPRWPDPPTELSYPDWIVARLAADLGSGPARAALEVMNTAAEMTTRDDGYVQDRASQLVAAQVGAEAGERILDLCAAPGGKATAMAYGRLPMPPASARPGPGPGETSEAAGPGAGERPELIVACDIAFERAVVTAGNAARLGLEQVRTVVADGTRPPWRPGTFDRVLVDAPCSGLGVLRRRPDARWRIQPGDLPRLAALQRRLLETARGLVRPGGLLVYSVCTLSVIETGAIDRWLASEHPDLVPLPPPADPWAPAGRGALLLPQAAGTDGMFLLRLRVP